MHVAGCGAPLVEVLHVGQSSAASLGDSGALPSLREIPRHIGSGYQ